MDRFTRLAIISKFDKANTGHELLTLVDEVVKQISNLNDVDSKTSNSKI